MREDAVHHQHRHVAPDAIALLGDVAERVDDACAQGGGECVELHDVGPGREVRIPAPGQHGAVDRDEGSRVVLEVLAAAAHEEFRVRARPRVVGCDVVGDEVQDEPQSVPGQRGAGVGQAVASTQARVDLVVGDAVRRPDNVFGSVVGQHGVEALDQLGVVQRDRCSRRAARPYPHQPHGIETGVGERGPPLVRHGRQIDRPARLDTQLMQPRPRIDLVKVGLRGGPPLPTAEPDIA